MKKIFPAFFLAGALLVASCSKKDESEPEPNNNNNSNEITINSSPRYSASIDSVAYSKVENGTTVVKGLSSTYDHPSIDTSIGNYTSNLNNPGVSTYIRLVRRGLVFTGALPDNSIFNSYFNPASYTYTLSGTDGIKISWYDNSLQEWSTDAGTADQTGSSFTITDIKGENTSDGYLLKIKATFTCKLYNGSGQSKTLTSGVYVGYFGNI